VTEREEWAALAASDTLHLLPTEALIASIRQLAGRLLDLTEEQPPRFWHAYQADMPKTLEDSLGAGMAFTIIADTPTTRKEAPETHLGTVFGQELTFRYLTTWDHEPSEAEREQAQLAQFQLAKEKEEQ
jgi:hypothetical protein